MDGDLESFWLFTVAGTAVYHSPTIFMLLKGATFCLLSALNVEGMNILLLSVFVHEVIEGLKRLFRGLYAHSSWKRGCIGGVTLGLGCV